MEKLNEGTAQLYDVIAHHINKSPYCEKEFTYFNIIKMSCKAIYNILMKPNAHRMLTDIFKHIISHRYCYSRQISNMFYEMALLTNVFGA